ncbi:MAG: methylated-DNA--[protein]-cysteine S-methyltransferase, partial [Desulfobaccales bacterium]
DTPLGPLGLHFSSKGLAALTFAGEEAAAAPAAPPAAVAAWIEVINQGFANYFRGLPGDFSSLPLDPHGTPFQLRVWQELQKIHWGETISYKELAARAGSPKGCRAVGQANGANPIPLIIPCHRVINVNGALGGFSSGLHHKRWLLENEKKD